MPAPKEYKQARVNAIKFGNYIESYRPIFSTALNLIKPGIEDLLQRGGTRGAVAGVAADVETLSIPTFAHTHLMPVPLDWRRMPIVVDDVNGSFPTAAVTRTVATTAADIATIPGVFVFGDPATRTIASASTGATSS